MSDTAGSADAAAFCAGVVKQHDFERYASTLFVTPARRRALLALYAFNVEIVRVREHIRQPIAGEVRLQWWSDMLAGAGHGYVEGSPVAAELMRAIEAHGLPIEPLARLIETHQFDLYNDPMPDMAALENYLDGTAATLFALAARILGDSSAEIEHVARHAGQAAGVADVIAGLPADASRRQLFAPLPLLQAEDIDAETVFAGREPPRLHAALTPLIDAAQEHLQAALTLLVNLPPAARPAFLPLALVRRALNDARRADRKLFAPRHEARLRVLWTLWRAARTPHFRGD
jgi:phytoene synthase